MVRPEAGECREAGGWSSVGREGRVIINTKFGGYPRKMGDLGQG